MPRDLSSRINQKMMQEENYNRDSQEEIFSKRVRAGKRTYFFDVKSTKGDDLYLTVTESKKRFRDDGTFYYEKHKIFLYKEDFEKFSEGLNDAIQFINSTNRGEVRSNGHDSAAERQSAPAQGWSDVDFDDLGGN